MNRRDIVVIGGSAGSLEPLRELLGGIPGDFGGSIFVVTHLPTVSARLLDAALAPVCSLPVAYAHDEARVEPGRVYLAEPNRHLLLVGDVIRHGYGPRENMVRPAIDPLFRSAAVSYGPRVTAVVLSGMLDDGASGLAAVAARDGVTIVQDPATAASPELPRAACQAVTPDYVAPPAKMGALIAGLIGDEVGDAEPAPPELALEVEIALGRRLGSGRLQRLGEPTAITCPTCAGVLSTVPGPPLRFRCQTGHGFSAKVLENAQLDGLEEAFRIALRVIEERVEIVTRMGVDARQTGRNAVASLYDARAHEYGGYARVLREASITMMRDAAMAREEDADT